MHERCYATVRKKPFFINIKQKGNISLVIMKQKHVSVKLIFPFRSKGKLPCASPESLLRSGGMAPRIINCGNRWVVRFTPWPLYRTTTVTSTRRIIGWVGPTVYLDVWRKEKVLYRSRQSNHDPSDVQRAD